MRLTVMPHPIPAADPRTDAELVRAVCEGDLPAFEVIVRRFNRLMFRTARGIVRDDRLAQDVMQETYLRAFLSLGTWRGEAALSTWLVRIAIHVALDAQHRQARWVSLEALASQPGLSVVDTGGDPTQEFPMTHADRSESGPENLAAQGQLRRLLERGIDQLPPIYRSVFILRAIEELSVEQTAQALAVSADVVKTRYARARTMLRGLLGTDIGQPLSEFYAFDGERCDAMVAMVMAAVMNAVLAHARSSAGNAEEGRPRGAA